MNTIKYPHPNPLPEGEGVDSATNYAVNSLSLGERARVRAQNVPQLRFPEFSGEWVERTLKDIVKINQGLQIPISDRFTEQVEDSYFYITNEFLKEGTQKKFFIKNPSETVLCDENDILMTRTGNTGKVVTNVSGAFHNNFFKIKYDDTVNKNFLVLFLTLNKTQDTIMRLAGTSTIPDLNHGDFYKISINLPSLPEQTKIAAFLSAVDTKIDQLTQKKTLLETYKKGAMQQIFSQQIRFTPDEGGEYPEWEEKKLGEVGSFIGGGTPETTNEDYWNGEIQWFTPTEIKQDFVSKSLRKITEEGLKKSSAKLLPVGTILVTTRATIGEVAIALNECTTNQGFQSIVVRDNSNIFIMNWLKFHKHLLIKKANGSTFPEISKSEMENIELIAPCLEEQTKIANFLSAIDRKIDLVSQQLEQAKAFKKGLLQQMFV